MENLVFKNGDCYYNDHKIDVVVCMDRSDVSEASLAGKLRVIQMTNIGFCHDSYQIKAYVKSLDSVVVLGDILEVTESCKIVRIIVGAPDPDCSDLDCMNAFYDENKRDMALLHGFIDNYRIDDAVVL